VLGREDATVAITSTTDRIREREVEPWITVNSVAPGWIETARRFERR